MQIAKQGIQVPKLGVGVDPDTTNPVSMVINKALFAAKTAANGGNSNMQYTLSKETAAATLSLLMQDNFSSRAEMGLLGNDDFTLQVTATGSSPIQALIAQAAAGFVLTPQGLGVNATPDATNKLSVNTAAVLFNNVGANIQTKLNKAAVGNTASFVFQDNFSTRAEIGLTGDDDFHFKVSANGSTFFESLWITASSGLATAKNGFVFDPASADPTTPVNGQVWYNSTTGKFRARQNAVSVDLIPAGSTSDLFIQQVRPVAAGPWAWWPTDGQGNVDLLNYTIYDGGP